MKTYDEAIMAVLDRMERYEERKKQRRAVCAKAAAGIGGLCLAVLLGLGVRNGNVPDGPDGTGGAAEDKIVICPVDDAAVQRMEISLMIADFVPMEMAELEAYYGTAMVPQVPSDLQQWEKQHSGIYRRGGGIGEIYWDNNVLNFSNEDFSRRVNLEVWKGRAAASCYAFFNLLDDKSVINNVEIAVGVSEDGDYHAEFSHCGTGFRLMAKGLSQEEVISVLRSLVR